MRLSRLCGIIALLVLLTSAGAALKLDVAGEKDWLVAGGDTAGAAGTGLLSLQISGGSGDFTISATVPPDGLCTVNPSSFTSSSNRPDPIQVWSKETSGVCQITITVTDAHGKSDTREYLQKIDHATPIFAGGVAPQSATAGTVIPVKVWVQDVYHNRVDNRNTVETVSFATYGRSGFVDGPSAYTDILVQTAQAPVDADGVALVYYYVGEYLSNNYVTYKPPGVGDIGFVIIDGVPNGIPAAISVQVSPYAATPPWVYADGSSKFSLIYTVTDTNGFPVQAARVKTTTFPEGWSREFLTDGNGQATFFYGPFNVAGDHRVTGILTDNPGVEVTATMVTISSAPDHLVATGNPSSMPSREVSATSYSTITGRVGDPKGNPVSGQKVTFQIEDFTASPALTLVPYLATNPDGRDPKYLKGQAVSATTNADGNAIVYFIPGEFQKAKLPTGASNPAYEPYAEGTATVIATWTSPEGKTSTGKTTLTFKRTAYLSLKTKVEDVMDGDQTVEVGGEFNVTIEVTGDGSLMVSNPIEVMLVTDRSTSMYSPMQGNTRWYWVQQAVHAFLDSESLSPGRDKVGLVSYHTWATKDADLTTDFTSLHTTIDQLTVPRYNTWVDGKGPNGFTNIRDGIFNGTSYLVNYGSKSPKVNKAIIVMTDGVWNWGGDPMAGAGRQSGSRGVSERTRLVVWTDRYLGYDCSSTSACAQKYYTGKLWWPGATTWSMYTYYPTELYRDLNGNPIMKNPGHTYFTGEGRDTATRQDGPDGNGGYLCHLVMPYSAPWDWTGSGLREANWGSTFCPTFADRCSGQIACYGNDKYRIDVCDPSIEGSMDCSPTEQNMAIFAKNNGIRIYTITYSDSKAYLDPLTLEGDVVETLQALSDQTGGKYYHAATGADLKQVYEDIASDLITSAGVDTSLTTDNSEVPDLINEGQTVKGNDAFSYVHVKGASTLFSKWDKNGMMMEGYSYYKNQDPDWIPDQKLTMEIGSLEVKQKWQMIYRLMAKKAGTYDVFGEGSTLKWTDWTGAPQELEFPKSPVYVIGGPTDPTAPRLEIKDLHTETAADGRTDWILENTPFTFNWKLYFSDTDSNGKANQFMSVRSIDNRIDIREFNINDDRYPRLTDQDVGYQWPSGLPAGTYIVTVSSKGSGNSAAPKSHTFTVGLDPNRAQIIIR